MILEVDGYGFFLFIENFSSGLIEKVLIFGFGLVCNFLLSGSIIDEGFKG